jgi:transcriptional regulator with GAF, ATPase, and Fis domain
VDFIAWILEGREERVGHIRSNNTSIDAGFLYDPVFLLLVRQAAKDSADVIIEASIMDQVPGSGLIGESKVLQNVMRKIGRIAPTDCPVLITGETGTGKELVARAIHFRSLRKKGPLVFVNCSAIPPSLIESELFGYERGAFTGATVSVPGRFGLAHTGTLVLDEISELPSESQAKLLRVVETGELERLGCRRSVKVDVRVVATTNCDLGARVRSGRFRSDLFYRLNVVPISLPPLRDRNEDIIVLAYCFLNRYTGLHQKDVQEFSPRAIELMRAYPWPGNVRELQHTIERAVLLSENGRISAVDICLPQVEPCRLSRKPTNSEMLLLRARLRTNKGNVSKTAREFGLSRKGLTYILEKGGIKASVFRVESPRRKRRPQD